jgi:hypothetical protein
MTKTRATIALITATVTVLAGLEYLLPQGIGADRIFERFQWMKVQTVAIDAEWPLTASRVRHWLPPLEGKNLLLLKAANLVDTLKKKPWVSEVTLKKQFPNRIDISVKTKRSYAVLVARGQGYFMDGDGNLIEKVEPGLFGGHDLPLVSRDRKDESDDWRMSDVLKLMVGVREKLGPSNGEVSEARLGTYPTLRLFLTNYKMEIVLSMENWADQLNQLAYLLQKPPRGLGSIRRINLTLAKKAVVSSSLSN